MNDEIIDIIKKITELAIKIQKRDIFVRYYANVEIFSVDIHDGKWSKKTARDYKDYSFHTNKASIKIAKSVLNMVIKIAQDEGITN